MTHLDPIYGIQSLLTRLEVSNTLLTALIDSGAVISVIRKSTLERIDGSLGCLEKPDIQAASVNGVPLSFSGKTHLQCRWFYGSTKFVGTFYFAEDVSIPVLLGMDLLCHHFCLGDIGYLILFLLTFFIQRTRKFHHVGVEILFYIARGRAFLRKGEV